LRMRPALACKGPWTRPPPPPAPAWPVPINSSCTSPVPHATPPFQTGTRYRGTSGPWRHALAWQAFTCGESLQYPCRPYLAWLHLPRLDTLAACHTLASRAPLDTPPCRHKRALLHLCLASGRVLALALLPRPASRLSESAPRSRRHGLSPSPSQARAAAQLKGAMQPTSRGAPVQRRADCRVLGLALRVRGTRAAHIPWRS
jgi:hypothetical protein